MGLNISKGNMYDFVTHTWNTVKGKCSHDCSYCYMKRWGKLKNVRVDEKELNTDLGEGNFIFVGSGNDLFSENILQDWIFKTIEHCNKYNNQYLFQSKNTKRLVMAQMVDNSIVCTTLETNRWYHDIMNKSPSPKEREENFKSILLPKYITIEPIMDFDLLPFIEMIKQCNPVQVNIGADSGGNNLPEPDRDKIEMLINELQIFTKVKLKKNISRIYNQAER